MPTSYGRSLGWFNRLLGYINRSVWLLILTTSGEYQNMGGSENVNGT